MLNVESWRTQVEAHHAQSLKAQGNTGPLGDFWRPFASVFRSNPRRIDDPVLASIFRHVGDDSTAPDVGGGAGRLVLRCAHVTVVTPSGAMVEEPREATRGKPEHRGWHPGGDRGGPGRRRSARSRRLRS